MCCIIGNQKIFHFNPYSQEHKFIEFDKSYGKISCFEWLGDDKLFVAFQTGLCAVVSVDPAKLGSELNNFRPVMTNIEQISINQEVKKVAIAAQG